MKVTILIIEKPSLIPLAECGESILAPGERLLVESSLVPKMLERYGRRFVNLGETERDCLKYGHYEIERASGAKPPLASSALNRSMSDKGRVKVR